MDRSKMDDKNVLPPEHSEEFDDKELAAGAAVGGSGGLGYPTHPEGEDATDPVEETLSNGTRGVDVSGVQTGSGRTRMTITPTVSNPKKKDR